METSPLFGTSKFYPWIRVAIGIPVFCLWLFLFGMGVSIPSIDLKKAMIASNAGYIDWKLFVLYGLTYTPISAAILSALAGMLGGVASNLTAYNEKEHVDISKLDPTSFEYRTLVYMSENPLVSMLRGFLAFLILVAGSYIASFSALEETSTGDAAKVISTTASSYFKFAVTVSLLSYLVGYDPSQLQRLIGSLTTIGGVKPSVDFAGKIQIKDGDQIAEGKFSGKATPSSTDTPAPASVPDIPEPTPTTLHRSWDR